MMQVKRYIAPTFAEALIQAKHELGTEAMIVESKKVRVGGFLGFFGREVTELTVASDRPVATRSAPPGAKTGRPGAQAPTGTEGPAPAAAPAGFTKLEREVASLRTAIGRLLEQGAADKADDRPDGYGLQVYEELIARGVEAGIALELGRAVGVDASGGRELFRRELARLLGPGAPIVVRPGQHRVVALVGPTGVGKTTTLAKLAARFTLEQGLRVALITCDTFRIAAVDQLRTYADILGIPMYAADTSAQLAQALRETAGFDLILADTAGRSHKHQERMEELRTQLAVIRPDEIHLVYALTANSRDALEALEQYLPLGVNRLAFTKLDESSSPGMILNVVKRCNQPLSYLTNGQSVPDDILPADRVDFSKVLAGEA